jgi:NMD protein affecting ribosome stability and mRNA decay
MPDRFCAICGKTITKKAPHFAMCLDCYLKEKPLFELPKKLSFKVCVDCGRFSKHQKWFDSHSTDILIIIKQALERFLLSSLEEKENLEFFTNFDETTIQYTQGELIRDIDVIINGRSQENPDFEAEQVVSINIQYELCESCSNLRSGEHYEAIIQLRVDETEQFDLIEDVIEKIHRYAIKQFESDRRQYIAKMIDQKYGVDLYLSTSELMKHIVSFLGDRYFFSKKRSKKLVGRDTQRGKNIYRLKTLIKFLPFESGDKLIIKGKEFNVLRILKNRVILKNENGRKVSKAYSFFFENQYSIKEI